jgi:hypothetical protein
MIHMADQKNICPDCGARMQFGSGCRFCPECGFGKCGRMVVQTVVGFAAMLVCLALVVTI